MKPALILALALAGPAATAAEIPGNLRHLTPPKNVELTPEQQKLLDLANASLAQGYRLLIERHDPGRAAEEFRKALVVQNRLAALVKKMETGSVGSLNNSTLQSTPKDKIESRGGIDKILELSASGKQMESAEAQYDLQKRKIIKDSARIAKDIDATQKQITNQLKQLAGGGGGGGGGGKQEKQDQPPEKQEVQDPPPTDKPTAGKPPAQTNPDQAASDGKPPGADQQTAGKPPAPGDQSAPARPGDNAGKTNTPPKPGQGGKPGTKASGGQGGGGGGGGEDQAKKVAAQQEQVAKALDDIADQLARQGGGTAAERSTADAFSRAATAAGETARALHAQNLEGAIAASQNAEGAIADALAKIGTAGTAALQQAVGALGDDLARLQGQQDKLIAQTRALGQGTDARDADLDRDRATRLMAEEGQLKERIEQLQKTLQDLAATIDQHNAGALTPETAAREGVGRAGRTLAEGKLRQHAIDATMKLGQGDLGGALTAMAGVQQEANAVRRDIDLANQALAGGPAEQMERDLAALQRLSSDLRRLTATAQALAGQSGGGGQGGGGAKTDKPSGGADQAALSGAMAKVVNASADAIREELAQLAPRLPDVAPDLSGKLLTLTAKPADFDRRFAESLRQLDELAATVEKLDGVMGSSLERELEKAATRDFLKDPIPPAYQAAVAAYLEALSKGAEKR